MDWIDTLHRLIGEERTDITWWQMSIRTGIVFFYGLVLLRLAHKRAFGRWSAVDVIFSVMVGSNLSRALTGNAPMVQTLVATTLLVALHAGLVTLAARVPALGPMIKGRPVQLIRDGAPDQREMRRHGVGEHDLQEALRNKGVADPSEAKAAFLERSGDISVLKR